MPPAKKRKKASKPTETEQDDIGSLRPIGTSGRGKPKRHSKKKRKRMTEQTVETENGTLAVEETKSGDFRVQMKSGATNSSAEQSSGVTHKISITNCLSEGWTILTKHVAITILPLLIAISLAGLITNNWQIPKSGISQLTGSSGETGIVLSPSDADFDLLQFANSSIAALLIFIAAAFPVSAALITLEGRFFSTTETTGKVIDSSLHLFLYYLLGAILMFTWHIVSLLIALPFQFLVNETAASIVFFVVRLIGFFVLLSATSLTMQAIVDEGRTALTGLIRSIELSTGFLWQILVILLITQVGGQLLSDLTELGCSGLPSIVSFTAANVALAVFKALETTALTVVFWRSRKIPR